MPDPNPIVFWQIATTPEGRAFYQELFDWQIADDGRIDPGGPGDFDPKGSFLPVKEGQQPFFSPWFRVLDLPATFEKAQALGATVLIPIRRQNEGGPHIALVRAPDGQSIGLVQA